MTVNFNKNPGFLLTRFHRAEGVPQADGLEKFGNFALGLLQLSSGRTVNVTKVVDELSEQKNWMEETPEKQFSLEQSLGYKGEKQYSLITRIALIAVFILFLPVTLPLALAGAIALHSSKSYSDLFPKKIKQDDKPEDIKEIDLKAMGFEKAYDAVNYLCKRKAKSADLRAFPDLEDYDLKALAHQCPQLKKLRINSTNVTELPSEFKNLEFLECDICTNLKSMPDDLPKLKTLILSCVALKKWPSNLKSLEVLHLIETYTAFLPSKKNLKNLKEFNYFNSTGISKALLAELPKGCEISNDYPKQY